MSTDALTPTITVVPTVAFAPTATYVPARQVWERYGITSMTLHRWVQTDRFGFPPPLRVGRMRFWRVDDLEAWEARHTRQLAARSSSGEAA